MFHANLNLFLEYWNTATSYHFHTDIRQYYVLPIMGGQFLLSYVKDAAPVDVVYESNALYAVSDLSYKMIGETFVDLYIALNTLTFGLITTLLGVGPVNHHSPSEW